MHIIYIKELHPFIRRLASNHPKLCIFFHKELLNEKLSERQGYQDNLAPHFLGDDIPEYGKRSLWFL